MPRRPMDFYETPPHYIAALLAEVNIYGRVYEPCVGEGAIAGALRGLPSVHKVITNDLDEDRAADRHEDSTRPLPAPEAFPYFDFDWIITNPPFSNAIDILEAMWANAHNLAFLARLSFLEPVEGREEFLTEHPPQQIIVLPRYSFRLNDAGKKATDSMTCCWLVWHKEDPTPRRTTVWGKNRAMVEAIYRGLPNVESAK